MEIILNQEIFYFDQVLPYFELKQEALEVLGTSVFTLAKPGREDGP